MTEPCDLPAVTARALIGERKLSPVELLESCIHRIEAIDPAVNAVIARSFETARATAQASEAAVMRGDLLAATASARVKDLIDAKGLRRVLAVRVLFADNIAAEDEALLRCSSARARSSSARPMSPNGARAATPATRFMAPPATRSTPRSAAGIRRIGSARHRHAQPLATVRHRRPVEPRRVLRCRRCPRPG